MKILFASHVQKHYLNQGEPLGIMFLSGALQAAGHQTRLVDADAGSVLRGLREFPAPVTAYSTTTGYHQHYRDLNETVKARVPVFAVFGGPHPTFFPDFIRESRAIDAVCRGEGEPAFLELARRLDAGEDYFSTRNFIFRKDGDFVANEVRPLVEDLDSLPFPDRELLYSADRAARRNPIKTFLTTRGCPYRCTYCFNHAYRELYAGKGRPVRRRGIGPVVREIREVRARYPLQMVNFVDDTFLLFPEWVEEFCPRYGAEVSLPFFCNGRLDQVREPLVRALKKAGLVAMNLAIETANDEVRDRLLDRQISREQIREGCDILRRHGIRILMQNMFALPGTSFRDDLDTYDLNRQNRVDYLHSSVFQPYPGTRLCAQAKKSGLLTGDPSRIRPEDYLRGRSRLRLKNRARRERLNKLAAIGSHLRLTPGMISLLTRLPLRPGYSLVHAVFKGYMGARLYPVRRTLRDKLLLAYRVFRMHHLF